MIGHGRDALILTYMQPPYSILTCHCRAGDPARLASCCETAGRKLHREGKSDLGLPWLTEACKQYRTAQQHLKALAIIEAYPDVLLVGWHVQHRAG